MKVRCPICNGCGGVEPRFGTGSCDTPTYTHIISSKSCPGCGGTGMQEFARVLDHNGCKNVTNGDVVRARLDSIEAMVDALRRDINRIDSRMGKPSHECACKPVKKPEKVP